MVGKYLANLNLNKTLISLCTYIINIGLEVPKNLVFKVIALKVLSQAFMCVWSSV